MSLSKHLPRVHDPALHLTEAGLEASPAHKLCRPVRYGGRWWVWCLGEACEWIGSCDREIDIPTRCEVEQLTATFEAETARVLRIAHSEFCELQRLSLKRTA